MNQKLRFFLIAILMAVLVAACAVVLVPYYRGERHESEISQSVSVYQERIAILTSRNQHQNPTAPAHGSHTQDAPAPTEPPILPELRKEMEQYNQEIYLSGQSDLTEPWSYQQTVIDLDTYIPDGIAAIIRIPKMDLELPIYLGATSGNLNKGAAQLSQTSMPIGGDNTNCVIAAHRSWEKADFFLEIEKLEMGDFIYIENPWETLTYKVSQIKLIEPYEVEEILIQPGRDLVTLFTCHPYLVSSHRYLVICERVKPAFVTPSITEPAVESHTPTDPIWANQGHAVIYTTEENFQSSSRDIFLDQLLPKICIAVLVLLASILIILLATYLVKIIRQHRHKGRFEA